MPNASHLVGRQRAFTDMSAISMQLQASARSAYRDLLRAAALTFRGDAPVRNGAPPHTLVLRSHDAYGCTAAFRVKMRSEVIPNTVAVTDPGLFEQKVTLAREIADVLRKNIVQARRVEPNGGTPEGEDMWSA